MGQERPGPPGQDHEGRGQQQLVGHGIEDGAQRRLLVADAGDQAVEEVRDPRQHEDAERPARTGPRARAPRAPGTRAMRRRVSWLAMVKTGSDMPGTAPLSVQAATKKRAAPAGSPCVRRTVRGAATRGGPSWSTSFATKSLQAFSWASPMPLLRHSSAFVPTPKPPLSKLKPPPLFEMPSPLTEATISPRGHVDDARGEVHLGLALGSAHADALDAHVAPALLGGEPGDGAGDDVLHALDLADLGQGSAPRARPGCCGRSPARRARCRASCAR